MGHARLLGSFLNGLDVAGHQEVDRGVDPFRYPPLTDARIHVGLDLVKGGARPLGGLGRGDVFHDQRHRRAGASPTMASARDRRGALV